MYWLIEETEGVWSDIVKEEWRREGDDVGDPGESDDMAGGGGVGVCISVKGDSIEDILHGCWCKLFMLFAPGICGKVSGVEEYNV